MTDEIKNEINDFINIYIGIDDLFLIDPIKRLDFLKIRNMAFPILEIIDTDIDKAYEMYKIMRKSSSFNIHRLKSLADAIKTINPDEVIHANKHLEYCEDKRCKFCSGERCCFGSRGTKGCYIEDMVNIGTMIEWDMMNARVKAENNIIIPETNEKVYDFEFKEQHFKLKDRAENQSECPHCGTATKGAWAVNPEHCYIVGEKRNNQTFGFYGNKKLSDNQYAVCFKCDCGKNFYYHTIKDDLKRKSMIFE